MAWKENSKTAPFDKARRDAAPKAWLPPAEKEATEALRLGEVFLKNLQPCG